MKIVKVKDQLESTKLKTTPINVFYKRDFKYTISIVENQSIIEVIKEDTKTEYFEIEYFEIKN